jgi:pimeloyl-ACP methyl ester carboxylesterase
MFTFSGDGTPIVYDITGDGPALILLHGFPGKRQVWHEAGYGEHLRRDFTVISIDLRGNGESGKPRTQEAYHVEKELEDLFAIADACSVSRFLLWGFSFGGRIALQAAARSDRIIRAVAAGCSFKRMYSEKLLRDIAWLERLVAAQRKGTLASLSEEEQAFAQEEDVEACLACTQALPTWPVVEPSDLRCPTFIYVGSADTPCVIPLMERKQDMEAAGIQLHIFEGLDHDQQLSARPLILPVVLPFLLQMR